jgi:gluconolactonase
MRRLSIPLLFALAAAIASAQQPAVEKILNGYQFLDGPAWSPEGFLLVSDVLQNEILKSTEHGMAPLDIHLDRPGGLAVDNQGRIYVCEAGARRVIRIDQHNRIQVLADRFEGRRLNGPNDIAVRKDDHVYFTDPAFGSQQDARELGFYAVYHLTPRRDLEAIARPKGRPNGIALSGNGRTLYVANSDERNVRAYDLDRGGHASDERIVISNIDGVPDGLCIGANGELYVAANALLAYSSEGRFLRKISLHERPSGCAFGGTDGKTLFITAQTSIYRVRLEGVPH